MALTLSSNIDDIVTELRVTGSVGVEVVTGYLFRIGTNAEILMLRAFGPGPIPLAEGNPLRIGKDPSHWFVERGVDSSVPHTHTAGDTVFGVVDAYTSGDSEAEPSPFPSGGGGATPALAEVLAQGNDTGGTPIVDAIGLVLGSSDTTSISLNAGFGSNVGTVLIQGGGSITAAITDAVNHLTDQFDLGGGSGFTAVSTVIAASAAPATAMLKAVNETGEASIAAVGANDAITPPYIMVTGMPTSDPGVAGALYTAAGVLMVSAG